MCSLTHSKDSILLTISISFNNTALSTLSKTGGWSKERLRLKIKRHRQMHKYSMSGIIVRNHVGLLDEVFMICNVLNWTTQSTATWISAIRFPLGRPCLQHLPDSERHMTSPCQGLSSLAPGGAKMRDPGNEVGGTPLYGLYRYVPQ